LGPIALVGMQYAGSPFSALPGLDFSESVSLISAVAPFSKGVVSAAQRGWTPISANFLQPPWVASHWPKYQEGCAAGGRTADSADWRVAKSIFVADDERTAREYAKGRTGPYSYYFHSLMTKLIANGRPELFKAKRDMPD
ncbi:MAG: hypothetical protein ABR591_14200, partial [Candidatus Velthaea sp.]